MSRLPPELAQLLNQAYFLHVLATDPKKLITPGKSLLSMLAGSHLQPDALPTPAPDAALHSRVEKVVHEAFWNEALESLSAPFPAIQLPRLKGLYSDLHDALSPLFPPTHPILQSLLAPLPPTSSPLHSTLALVKEILTALRTRCAPVRDDDVDALLVDIDRPPPPVSGENTGSATPLASHLVQVLRRLLALATTLKADLTHTVLGAMSEAQLADAVAVQARARERELVQSLWGREQMEKEWHAWVQGSSTPRREWVAKLMQALKSSTPVSCEIPDPAVSSDPSPPTTTTALPPQFFFTAPALLYIQNYLQALVATAALRALAPPSTPGSDFSPRVWALLKAEIDRDVYAVGVPVARSTTEEGDATKIINLADEVVRARRLAAGASVLGSNGAESGGGEAGMGQGKTQGEEVQVREAVERTLRLQDPVFKLLMGRVVRAVEEGINGAESAAPAVPDRMRTGRGAVSAGRMEGSTRNNAASIGTVKGFEDPVLVEGVQDVVDKLTRCVDWVEALWGDTMK